MKKLKKVTALFAGILFCMTLLSYTTDKTAYAAEDNVVIVLDPGHDETHTGAVGYGIKEHVINMKIALACKEELENYMGVTVYLTHDTLECPFEGSTSRDDLIGRAEYAGSVGASLYVSLHNNSGKNISGYEIYYPNANYVYEYQEIGYNAALCIGSKLEQLGLNCLDITYKDSYGEDDGHNTTWYPDGSRADYYSVIRNSKYNGVPAIIVEHAYLSNYYDAHHFLADDMMLIELGKADAAGIAQYYGLRRKSDIIDSTIDYSIVFDKDYYYNTYPDVAEYAGDDYVSLLEHFILYGMQEGRKGNEDFDVNYYRNRYPDLQSEYKGDLTSYYMHYISFGKGEGRIANSTEGVKKAPLTYMYGIDYSDVYDYTYYIEHFSDINEAYGGDDYKTLMHFVENGMNEGRCAKETFDVYSYKNANLDLRNEFGDELRSYYQHYAVYGKNENREAVNCTKANGAVSVYRHVDYSSVYNYDYYIANNQDVYMAYGGDDILILKHFVQYGMNEGRIASEEFNCNVYKNTYADLENTFNDNIAEYYMHYIRYGKSEGRRAA